MNDNKKPILSILIPTYNYKIGIARLLYFLKAIPKDKCEIIIYDNSPNEDTKRYMDEWILNNENINITYKLNRPVTSPAENWNNLIENSKGMYCLLLHNGEIPESSTFIEQLVDKLGNSEPDLALVNCILIDSDTKRTFFHLPIWLKGIVIKKYPKYIFQQNVIGPTSTIIIKKEIYSKFDYNLKWLLDVDSYYRSLLVSKKIDVYRDLNIFSISDKSDTLTSQLGSKTIQIEKDEKIYLSKKYNNILWNKQKTVFFETMIIFFEKIVWKIFTKIYKLSQFTRKKRFEESLQKIWIIK